MAAGGSDSALFHDDDPVGRSTVARRWAMTIVVRPADKAASARLHSMLRFGIERARRLVEQQDRRVAQNGAGRSQGADVCPPERRTPFSPRKVAQSRVQASRNRACAASAGGADLRLCSARSAEARYFPRIGAKITGSAALVRSACAPRRIGSADRPHRSARRRAVGRKTQQQLENRRLASARGADERHRLAPQHGDRENPGAPSDGRCRVQKPTSSKVTNARGGSGKPPAPGGPDVARCRATR